MTWYYILNLKTEWITVLIYIISALKISNELVQESEYLDIYQIYANFQWGNC